MEKLQLPTKKTAINPLWIISIFFSFAETVLGYMVSKTMGGVQIALTAFVIAFPTFVSIMFFVILWHKPKHLYAPTDYQSDKNFLASFEGGKTADNLSRQIETTVKQSLTSKTIVQELKDGKKTEEILTKTAQSIIDKIRKDSFLTVDLSKFNNDTPKSIALTYDDIVDFNQLTNVIYFKLIDVAPRISPYSYGYEWVIRHKGTNAIIKGSRMIIGAPKGERIEDIRTLEEVGVLRGDTLIVDKP